MADISETTTTPNCCDICGECFASKTSLKSHRGSHFMGQKIKSYKCESCGKCFNQGGTLKRHMLIHTGEKPYTCDFCGKCYRHLSALNKHVATHKDLCTTELDNTKGKLFENTQKLDNNRLCKNIKTETVIKNEITSYEDSSMSNELYSESDNNNSNVKATDEVIIKQEYTSDKDDDTQETSLRIEQVYSEKDQEIRDFTCDVCGKSVGDADSLRVHKKSHLGIKTYECDVCGKFFLLKQVLRQHKKCHSGIKPYDCDICGHRFLYKSSLKVHKVIHTGTKPFKCEICEKCFSSNSNLKSHIKIHTGELRRECRCGICGKTFSRRSTLTTHLVKMHPTMNPEELGESSFTSIRTETDSGSPAGYPDIAGNLQADTFMKTPFGSPTHKPVDLRMFGHLQAQNGCRETAIESQTGRHVYSNILQVHNVGINTAFKSRSQLHDFPNIIGSIQAEKNTVENMETVIKQEPGDMEFDSIVKEEENSLMQNFGKTHSEERAIKNEDSNHSDESYIDNNTSSTNTWEENQRYKDSSLSNDMNAENNISNDSFSGEVVVKNEFISISEDEQETTVQSKEKPHKCDTCGKFFTEKYYLKRHVLRYHTVKERTETFINDPRFRCDICGKFLANKNCLRNHKRIHNEDRQIECDICGKVLANMSCLRSHNRLHTGENKLKCDLCGECFATKTSLKKHKDDHLEGKELSAYKCELCGKCFNQSGTLKRHFMTHTGEKPYSCQYCGKYYRHLSALHKHEATHRVSEDAEKIDRSDLSENIESEIAYKSYNDSGMSNEVYGENSISSAESGGEIYKRKPSMGNLDKQNIEKNAADEEDSQKCNENRMFANLRTEYESVKIATRNPSQRNKDGIETAYGSRGKTLDYPNIIGHMQAQNDSIETALEGQIEKNEHPNISSHVTAKNDLVVNPIGTIIKQEPGVELDDEHDRENMTQDFAKTKYAEDKSVMYEDSNMSNEIQEEIGSGKDCGEAAGNEDQQETPAQRNKSPYKCDTCGRCYKEEYFLTRHIEQIHMKKYKGKTTNPRFMCNICGKFLKNRDSLRVHKKIHTGERHTKCDVCGKVLANMNCLRAHRKTHTGENYLKCDICGESFARKASLKKHRDSHIEGKDFKSFKCEICGKCFTQNDTLKRHMMTHTEDRPYSCGYCGKCYRHLSTLNKHVLSHSASDGDLCQNNEADTVDENETQFEDSSMPGELHGESIHSNTDIIEGTVVKKESSLISESKQETPFQDKERPYSCESCGSCFTEKQDLTRHIRSVHTVKPKNNTPAVDPLFMCSICGKVLANIYSLRVHKRIHTGEKPFKCDICDKRFTKNYCLKQHKLIHAGVKDYECDICGHRFRFKANLTAHRITHSNLRPYRCEICDKYFTDKSYLRRHIRTIHIGEPRKRYKCQICGKTLCAKAVLKRHTRKKHGVELDKITTVIVSNESAFESPAKTNDFPNISGSSEGENITVEDNMETKHDTPERAGTNRTPKKEKRFKCITCGKRFYELDDLEMHKRNHTGDKTQKCNICGERFSKTTNLKHHKRTHSGERPFKCEVCGKCFGLKNTLLRHMRTHTGEMPYKCDLCGKSFIQLYGLKKHAEYHMDELGDCINYGNIIGSKKGYQDPGTSSYMQANDYSVKTAIGSSIQRHDNSNITGHLQPDNDNFDGTYDVVIKKEPVVDDDEQIEPEVTDPEVIEEESLMMNQSIKEENTPSCTNISNATENEAKPKHLYGKTFDNTIVKLENFDHDGIEPNENITMQK